MVGGSSMKISRLASVSPNLWTYAGFLVGILAVFLLNHMTKVQADDLSFEHYSSAPRELQISWLMEDAARETKETRVLVGSSIVKRGFAFEGNEGTSRLWIPSMSVDQSAKITSALMSREMPPKAIIVDWASLAESRHVNVQSERLFPTVTFQTLAFQAVSFLDRPHRPASGPWKSKMEPEPYKSKPMRTFLAYAARLPSMVNYDRFLTEIEADCQRSSASISIVRFPLYLTQDNYPQLSALSDPQYVDALRSRLKISSCQIQFVDFFEDSLEEFRTQSKIPYPETYWFDINHFNSRLGEKLLADPRLQAAEPKPNPD